MQEGKPRLARLTAILTQLQSKRMVTARELATKHDVSIRTIYRDIRTLEKSGIPIVTEEGKGYCLMEGYKLPPVMFSEEEANALITAEKIILKNKDKSLALQYRNAIDKIKAVLKYSQKDKSQLLTERVHVFHNYENEKTSDYLIRVQSSITNYQLVQMEYLSLENKSSERVIEPFALLHSRDNWVLIAYCRLRKAFRAFRLDCIQKYQPLSDQFEPHKLTLKEYFDQFKDSTDNP